MRKNGEVAAVGKASHPRPLSRKGRGENDTEGFHHPQRHVHVGLRDELPFDDQLNVTGRARSRHQQAAEVLAGNVAANLGGTAAQAVGFDDHRRKAVP